MKCQDKEILQKVADTVRVLSAEGVEKAGCGHPGLPLGCAELGAYLYAKFLRHNPANPEWAGRDRFVLSAGHGSMFIYSLLHLSGYEVSLDDLKSFRQLGSKTPGHPEFGEAPGVETTTGPLGQGLAAAAGMAAANKMLEARFGKELFGGKVIALCGDGCMMEGLSHESGSLAGHLKLNNLVVIYDSNNICLDGPTADCFDEDTAARYRAYGWRVIEIDGHCFDQIESALTLARCEKDQPVLIVAKTVIGKGSPKKQGTNAAHGAKLGQDEIDGLKKSLGWPEETFHVPAEVTEYFKGLQPGFAAYETKWNEAASKLDADTAAMMKCFLNQELPADFDDQMWNLELPAGKATRSLSQGCLNQAAKLAPWFVTGSADLSCSDSTGLKGGLDKSVTPSDFNAQQFKYGVREFAMGTMLYGMKLGGAIQPIGGTFLTFSDYMRNAIRIAALMKQRVFYQFTHDTVLMGEDGPTHQPIEHVMSLRLIPNLTVLRPGDENETKAAWITMFHHEGGPVAFIGSRQNVRSDVTADLTAAKAREGVARGGYIVYGAEGDVDVMLFAAGSELASAVAAAKSLEAEGKTVRVVSLPSWELFEAQDKAYQDSVAGGNAKLRVSIEAGRTIGWERFVGRDGLTIGIDTFGISAPGGVCAEEFGLTDEKILAAIKAAM